MYTPRFNYSDKLVQNLVKVEHNKTILQNTDLSYNVRHKLDIRTKTLDLFHIAQILKLDLTLKDSERLANNVRLDTLEELRGSIIKNFRNAIEFNRSTIADTYSELDKSVILHLNKLVLTQWRETWEASFRNFNDKIDDRWDTYVNFRDISITVEQIPHEIEELIEWYKYSVPAITPLVRIAVVMYRLVEICPFIAGNKLTIMAIIDYLMLKNGYSSKVYSSVVRSIEQSDEKLIRAMEVARRTFDLSFWIDTFVGVMAADLINIREEINQFIVLEEKSKQQPFLNLNKRQLKVLKYLQNVPSIKREDYCHMMEVSTMTAFRDLNDLVRKKLVKLEGQGRGTKYKLASM
jgi:Fic family protein